MIFGRLMLQKPNILLMDESTNHLDMESIEALNLALDNYEGTFIRISDIFNSSFGLNYSSKHWYRYFIYSLLNFTLKLFNRAIYN